MIASLRSARARLPRTRRAHTHLQSMLCEDTWGVRPLRNRIENRNALSLRHLSPNSRNQAGGEPLPLRQSDTQLEALIPGKVAGVKRASDNSAPDARNSSALRGRGPSGTAHCDRYRCAKLSILTPCAIQVGIRSSVSVVSVVLPRAGVVGARRVYHCLAAPPEPFSPVSNISLSRPSVSLPGLVA